MKIHKIILTIALAAILIAVGVLFGTGTLSFDSIVNYFAEPTFSMWIVFLIFYIVATALAVPITLLGTTAGYVFGLGLGFVTILIGTGIGSVIPFLASRYLFHDYFQKEFAHHRLLKWSTTKNQHTLFRTALYMRLLVVFPFSWLNYVFGLLNISTRNYFFSALFGTVVAAFIYASIGGSLHNILSAQFFAGIGLFIIVAIVAYRYKDKLFK